MQIYKILNYRGVKIMEKSDSSYLGSNFVNTRKIQNNMVKFRKEKKLTQNDVAKKLNISRSTYAYYEDKAVKLSIELVSAVAAALQVNTEQLLNSERHLYNASSFYNLNKAEDKLLKKFRFLPKSERNKIIKYTDELYANTLK